ncbi:MAG: TRAP transporter TatT component family protein [Acidobacteriia bacterium]|nr:TRAP transporter TatT component family protein [Terriglobia bacterium]
MGGRFRCCVAIYGVGMLAMTLSGCSIKRIAINTLGNALSEGSSAFGKDDDPELVRDAVPFALKTIESLIEQAPKHEGLLTAASSGFTEYAYAFVQQEADYIEEQDFERAKEMRARAKKLYLRALGYGMRGLEVECPGFRDLLRKDPDMALAKITKKRVPLLYWTGAAWAAAFAINKADSELSADQSLMEKIMQRALALDEGWETGSIHDFFISWEGGHASAGGSYEKARRHFELAVALSKGLRAGSYVSMAEVVSVGTQNKKEFQTMLDAALKIDINQAPNQRLANVVSQRRARWLLARIDELFTGERQRPRTSRDSGPKNGDMSHEILTDIHQ